MDGDKGLSGKGLRDNPGAPQTRRQSKVQVGRRDSLTVWRRKFYATDRRAIFLKNFRNFFVFPNSMNTLLKLRLKL
ncbi:hypothetical protein U1Q18_013373, partial [Sarracenia purpurea var. burkii]